MRSVSLPCKHPRKARERLERPLPVNCEIGKNLELPIYAIYYILVL